MVVKGRVLSGFSGFFCSHLLMRPQPFAVCCFGCSLVGPHSVLIVIVCLAGSKVLMVLG